MDDLLTIGRFSRLTGLRVGAVRHYDELDLLRPARTIVQLRDIEVPLETIREVLASDDLTERRRLLAAHRVRIEARTFRLQRVLHLLGQLSSEDPTDMTATPAAATDTTELDPTTRRKLAADLYNHTWTLLEKTDRTPAEDDEMIHSAHASRYHWGEVGVGEPVNLARGEWQCSHRLRGPRACRAGTLECASMPRDQRGEWPGGLGPRVGVRGDGQGAPRCW